MGSIQSHVRRTFLAGIFAAIPIAVTGFVIYYVDAQTRILSRKALGVDVPFLGVALAVVAIYLLGFVVTSLIGRLLLRAADRLLTRMPLLKPVYQTWKQVVLTPGEGIFAKVVLVADESGRMNMLGFTSGVATSAGGDTLCVFIPAAPNPTSGRLYFVRRKHCQMLPISSEEAFKMILSGGSYVPAGIA
jgi:uncharacterized membrane protein